MRGLLARMRAVVRRALRGLLASPVPSLVAVGTIAISLVLVGAFALLVSNMQRLSDRFGEDVRVSAYLEPGLDEAAWERLRLRVLSAPGVSDVELVTPAQAAERFRGSSLGRAALLEGLEENPLPASLEIALLPEQRNAAGAERIAAALEGEPGIEEIGYGHEWLEGYGRAISLVSAVALAIGAVLALATLLIVAGTIRLALYARRDEIEILRLVGATRGYVAAPFLLEGLMQGVAGGVLALSLLYLAYRVMLPALAGSLELLLGYATPEFLPLGVALRLLLAGALLGVLGSATALGEQRS